MSRESAKTTKGGAQALRVLKRLVRETGSKLSSIWAALGCIIGEEFVSGAVITALLFLIFLTISPDDSSLNQSFSPTSTLKTTASTRNDTTQENHPGASLTDRIKATTWQWLKRHMMAPGGDKRARLRNLGFFVALMFLAAFMKFLFGFGRSYFSERFAQGLIRDTRALLFQHILRQSLAFHRRRSTGDLMSRVSSDVAVLQRALSADLMQTVSAPIAIAISTGVMVFISPQLTLFVLICLPGVALLIARSGDRLRRLAREVQVRLGTLNIFLQERLSGIETVQIFGSEDREMDRFSEINLGNFQANLRVSKTMAMLQPMLEFIGIVGILIVIFVAGFLTIEGRLQVPGLMAFGYVSQRLGSRLSLLGKIWLSAQQAAAAGDRIFEILDTGQEVPEAPDAIELPRTRGEIVFHHVQFGYNHDEAVLQDVDVKIAAGQVVALVGSSGAGKTSMVNLIPRFYAPSAGHIEIDGYDIAKVTLRSLRSQIGIVPQEPILFSGSIAENISYGRPEATTEEIEAAARAANAAEFIRELPQGYDTSVGERGAKLSGGQRQRIAIARALLRDPRILILDEATSALDAESEALVQDALERLMEGRTTVVIAHRLSTIQRVDRILVLAGGKIEEDGSHEELFRKGGLYRRLYEAQLQPYGEEASARP